MGGADLPAVVYFYALDCKAERPIAHLADSSSTLHVDGYGRYRVLADKGTVTLAFCRAHVRCRFFKLAAERVHADDTTVPILAKGKTVTGRIWTYVRDDRPIGGSDFPAEAFFASRDRTGAHPRPILPAFGIMQADAYAGFDALTGSTRRPQATTDRRGRLLRASPPQAIRSRQGGRGADRRRGGDEDRVAICHRARD